MELIELCGSETNIDEIEIDDFIEDYFYNHDF